LEAQLNQEKRLRKQAEEKANMLRCPDSCKMKKMHLEAENNKLRRDVMILDEAKNNLEKQNRMYDQEVSRLLSHLCEIDIIVCLLLFSYEI
jgi:hypothetical protein